MHYLSHFLFVCIVSISTTTTLFAQQHLKEEMRATWISSVFNLDWPDNKNASMQEQLYGTNGLIPLLDDLKASGINAVFFQVRAQSDALYNSNYDPWSEFVSGSEGVNPGYDPLAIIIEECHKRGMELHAWFNPYRASVYSPSGKAIISERPLEQALNNVLAAKTAGITPEIAHTNEHVTKKHPEWILRVKQRLILNPGIPEVKDYITNVVLDVVNNYNIDGVHFDDYFYPYPSNEITNEDASTFSQYPRGFTNIGDWRRDNINLLIKQVSDSIRTVKDHVKFGVSPFGIWKAGTPSWLVGMNAYSVIFADALAWVNNKSVDYLTPQTYWKISQNNAGQSSAQDFIGLTNWWADQMDGLHLYVGQGAYRADANTFFGTIFDSNEMSRQVSHVQANADILGSVHFRADNLSEYSSLGLADTLKNNYYKYPSVPPRMAYRTDVAPATPINFSATITNDNKVDLVWADGSGNESKRFIIYRVESSNAINPADFINDPKHIISLTGETSFNDEPANTSTGIYHYFVSEINRVGEESTPSAAVTVNFDPSSTPDIPTIVTQNTPANESTAIELTPTFSWQSVNNSDSYDFQLATDNNFTNTVSNQEVATNTLTLSTALAQNSSYFWRVRAKNSGGSGPWSSTWRFTTQQAVPTIVTQNTPANESTAIELTPTFSWQAVNNADSYDFQLSETPSFNVIAFEQEQNATTLTLSTPLAENTTYYWRVRARNSKSVGAWSTSWKFTTVNNFSVNGEWFFHSLWPPSSSVQHASTHGIAVDGNNRVWVQPFGATENITLANGATAQTRALYVFNSDGSQAPFSPITVFSYANGEVDTVGHYWNGSDWVWLSGRGLQADDDGNIIVSTSGIIYRISKEGQGLNKYVYRDTNGKLVPPTSAAVDADGNVYIAPVSAGAHSLIKLPKNFNTSTTPEVLLAETVGFSRTFEVSADGNTIYWGGYTNAGVYVYSRANEFTAFDPSNYTELTGLKAESMEFHPITGDLWMSAGSSTDIPSNGYDIQTWYSFAPNDLSAPKESIIWNADAKEVDGGRPRAIAFSNNGKVAYVGQFSEPAPSVQKFVSEVSTSVDEAINELPTNFVLEQNYPNPFNPTTAINFTIPAAKYTVLEVYDQQGRLLNTLVSDQLAAGEHTVNFDASNFSSGIYIYRLRVGDFTITRKMTLLK